MDFDHRDKGWVKQPFLFLAFITQTLQYLLTILANVDWFSLFRKITNGNYDLAREFLLSRLSPFFLTVPCSHKVWSDGPMITKTRRYCCETSPNSRLKRPHDTVSSSVATPILRTDFSWQWVCDVQQQSFKKWPARSRTFHFVHFRRHFWQCSSCGSSYILEF